MEERIQTRRYYRLDGSTARAWANGTVDLAARTEPVISSPSVVDNYYVRSLLGRDVFSTLKPGAVTSAHSRAAAAVLARFDAVLILERLDESFRQVAYLLGWCVPATLNLCNNTKGHCASSPSDQNASDIPRPPPLTDEDWAFFRDRNAPDAALSSGGVEFLG